MSLPTGTVTFFLADVEGSTGMQQNARLDYPATLRRIRALLESATRAQGGETVDAVGDEFLAAFSAAQPAAVSALAAQRALRDEDWPEDVSVRVRIGLHTGTPSFGDEGYTGIDIVRAARIANAGHGGQILLSTETLALIDSVTAVDLGSHRIQGLEEPERIHQLVADDLPRDFPSLRNPARRSAATSRSSSPTTASSSARASRACSRTWVRGGRAIGERRGFAPPRSHAQTERRGRGHPHAAEPHRRGPPRSP